MTTYTAPSQQTSNRSIGNLDGTSSGIGGTDTVRVQSGTGDFLQVNATLVDNSYVSAKSVNLNIKIQNVGVGAGVFARQENDQITYSFRRLQGGSGISVIEVGDSIVISGALGVDRFINLKDVPATYANADGKFLAVDATNNQIIFRDLPTDNDTFLLLTDTPDTYAGALGQFVRVGANGLEFSEVPAPTTTFLALTDTPNSYAGSDGKFLAVDANSGQIVFTDIVLPTQGARITFAEVPPTNPAPMQGDGWWNTDDGSFYLYYTDSDSGQWVESGSGEAAAIPQVALAYDYGAFFDGTPGSSAVLYRWRAPRDHTLAANFDGCLFTAGSPPGVDFICSVFVNGTQVGTWTIHPSGASTLLSSGTGPIVVPQNQEIKIVGPMQSDGSIADLVVSFKGERT